MVFSNTALGWMLVSMTAFLPSHPLLIRAPANFFLAEIKVLRKYMRCACDSEQFALERKRRPSLIEPTALAGRKFS